MQQHFVVGDIVVAVALLTVFIEIAPVYGSRRRNIIVNTYFIACVRLWSKRVSVQTSEFRAFCPSQWNQKVFVGFNYHADLVIKQGI